MSARPAFALPASSPRTILSLRLARPRAAARFAMEDRQDQVTRILQGGGAAEEQLLPLVYDELMAIAKWRMNAERANHTLQATALVHEAWMRLAGDDRMAWNNRRHFYGAAAEAMRRILVDHARRVGAQKRGGDWNRVTLGGAEDALELGEGDLLAVDEALEKLAGEDEEAAEVTRLRFFSGLSVEETAAALELSERTVARRWTFARARLFELLAGEAE